MIEATNKEIFLVSIPFSLGTAALVGATLFPIVAVIGALALSGFTLLLTLPLCVYTAKLFFSAIKREGRSPFLSFCFALILSSGIFFGGLALSHMICNSLGSVTHISYIKALEFGGIHLGITVVGGLGTGCLIVSTHHFLNK